MISPEKILSAKSIGLRAFVRDEPAEEQDIQPSSLPLTPDVGLGKNANIASFSGQALDEAISIVVDFDGPDDP